MKITIMLATLVMGVTLGAVTYNSQPQPQQAAVAQPQLRTGAITSFACERWAPPNATAGYPVMYRFYGTLNAPNPWFVSVNLFCNGKMFAGLGICGPQGEFSGLVYLRYGIDREFGPSDTVTALAVDSQGNRIGTATVTVP